MIVDWVPAHFPKDAHGLALFRRHGALRTRRSAAGRASRWGTLIFNYGRNEVREFLISNALFWLKEYHIDGLRVDAVASMLYLDYSRKAGEWIPNRYGGNENLEAIDFLRRFNELAHQVPGAITIAEESTALAGVSRPVYLNGLGFTMKWNMGWMHDMLHYFTEDPDLPQVSPATTSRSACCTRSPKISCCRFRTTKWCTARARCSKDAGRRMAALRQRARVPGYMYAHPGQEAAVHGIGDRAVRGVEPRRLASAGTCCSSTSTASCRMLVQELNGLYRANPALLPSGLPLVGLRVDRFHDAEIRSSPLSAARTIRRITCCSAAISRRWCCTGTSSACPTKASTRKC